MRTILATLLTFVFLFAESHHIASRTVTAGEEVNLSITIENTVNLKGVFLHYRTNMADEFKTVRMNSIGFDYNHTIQIPTENYSNLEYYFSIMDKYGRVKTDPVNNAYNKPYTSQIVNYKKQTAVNYLIISPEENEEVAQEDFMVSLSLLEVPAEFNMEYTQVFLDGINITKFATFDDDLVSWVPSNNIKKGPHNVDIKFFNNTNEEIVTASWNFTIVSDEEGTESLGGSTYSNYSGSVGFNNRNEAYGDPNAEIDGKNYLTTNAAFNLNYGPIEFQFNSSTSSEQKDNIQNVNRITGRLKYEPFDEIYIRLNVGDVSPKYNSQMFNFENMRGYNAGLFLGVFNFQYAEGDNRKEILNDLVTTTNDTGGVVISADINSSYQRKFQVGRFSIGNKDRDGFSLGFNFLKSADQTFTGKDTLNYSKISYTPSENLVFGTDFLIGFAQNRIRFTAGGFGSIYMDDVSSGPLDLEKAKETFGEKTIKGIENYWDDINKIITISGLPDAGYTYYGTFDFNYWGNFIKVRYDFVNPAFQSAGNPFLINDMNRISYFHSIRLFDNQLYGNFSLKKQNNNVTDNKEFNTTNINDMSIGFTYYPKFDLPNIALTYTKNDQEDVDSLDATQSSINNTNLSATMSYTMDIFGINSNLSLIFGTGTGEGKTIPTDGSALVAKTDKALASKTSNFAVTGAFKYPGLPLRLFGEISSFTSEAGVDSLGKANTSKNTGFRTNANYDLWQSETAGTFGTFAELAFNNTATAGADFGVNSISQTAISFGGSYKYDISKSMVLNSYLRFKTIALSGDIDSYSNRYITLSSSLSF